MRFSDGVAAEIDLRGFIANDAHPIVAALRDRAAFAALSVQSDTVVWSNGLDLAPEFLYERIRSRATA